MDAKYVIELFRTPLWTVLSDLLISTIVLSFFISLLTETIKNTIEKVFKQPENKILIWIINIGLVILFCLAFMLAFNFNKEGFNALKFWGYSVILILGTWATSFLSYIFVVKWFMLLMEIIFTILKNLKAKAELGLVMSEKEKLKTTELTNKVQDILNIGKEQNVSKSN